MPPEGPPKLPAAPLRLIVDHDALAANWHTLDRLSGTARAGAAVKANGYGLGARAAVRTLGNAGCRDFFVAHWQEADELLDLVDPASISVLHGPATSDEARWAKAAGVRPALNSLDQVARWQSVGGGPCDIMVDTGINRLGLALSDLGDPAIAALDIDIAMSHLACADEDNPRNAVQMARWREACGVLQPRRASLANSAGIALGAAYHGDLTRPGLALYGGIPRAEFENEIAQVARIETMVLQVREIAAGEGVGYNATFTAPHPLRIGTVALGYADGFLRAWSDCGMLRSNGSPLPVIGRVSMDMSGIDLSAAPDVREGDWVEVDYALPAAAQASGLSQYELLTILGQRFSR